MTYAELTKMVAHSCWMSVKDTRLACDRFLAYLEIALEEDPRMHIPGFGIFRVRERKRRRILHPESGVVIRLPATKEVRFYASTKWKTRLNRKARP